MFLAIIPKKFGLKKYLKMDKEYVFKINMSDLFQNGISDVEKLLKDNNINYTLDVNDIIKDNENKVIYYYTSGYSDNCFIKIDDQHLIINIDNDDDYLYQVTDYIRNRVNEILIKFKYAKYFRKPMVDFDYSHNNNYYKASLFLHVKTNHKKIIPVP